VFAIVESMDHAATVSRLANRWLIARGKGHAVMHGHHSHTR
jgi:hypothetical protein